MSEVIDLSGEQSDVVDLSEVVSPEDCEHEYEFVVDFDSTNGTSRIHAKCQNCGDEIEGHGVLYCLNEHASLVKSIKNYTDDVSAYDFVESLKEAVS
jgi:hypothetical protein